MTKGAFSRSRSKLKPEAFAELNQVALKSFYANAPCRHFRGFRVLAVDGSTAVLPTHESIIKDFGTTQFGPYADSPRSVARISVLYDVLNLTILDGQIDKYNTSERTLARRHFDAVTPGKDIVLFDRGYPSLALMFEMQAKGIDYVIRMRDGWWHEVRKIQMEDIADKEVTFRLPEGEKALLHQYHTTDASIKCRLVNITLADGATEVLCTSIRSKEALPYSCFRELYHFRWNIEEGYKLFKSRMSLEAFSGKTSIAIRQDFFAKLFTMTLTAILSFPIDEKLKHESQPKNNKHTKQINRTNALAMTKEITVKIFIDKMIKPALQALDKILKATTELIRPGRKFNRKKLKKKPPSMNYKQL